MAVLVLTLWGAAAHAQPSSADAPRAGEAAPSDSPAASSEAERYLQEIVQMTEAAVAASQQAAQAETVGAVKAGADAVFEALWGRPSGLSAEDARGASFQHGWKTRWQTTYADFDSAYAARYGSAPPEIEDPQQLGILGRGLHARTLFVVVPDSAGPETPGRHFSHEAIVAPLSNAIGWMRLDNGITKGELQPRVDLTYKWDAPIEFWQSTADTGWLHEAHAQATNILKTDYEGDAALAREHAATMTQLLEKALDGVDANQDGTVEPVMMEGGLRAALHEAETEEKTAEPAANSPVGTWSLEVEAPEGTIPATLNIAGEQGAYSGVIAAEDGTEAELQDVAMNGSELSLRFQHPQYGTIRLNATIEGDAFSGTLDVGGDEVPVSGTRTSEEDGTAETGENTAAPAAKNLIGTWNLEVEAPDGTIPATLTLAEEQGSYSGAISGEDGSETELQSVEVNGSELSFQFRNPQYGMMTVNATVEGDTLSGTLDAGGDEVPVSGTRASTDANTE